jgi:hypothetical protein
VSVSDKEYEHTILRGIPTDLATFASQILSSVLVIQSATPININALINLINEEAERLKSRRTRGHSGQGGKKDATTDEALAATSSEGGKKKHRKGNCHNCGKAGHWTRECRSPKKEKDDSAGTTAVQTSSTSHKLDNKPWAQRMPSRCTTKRGMGSGWLKMKPSSLPQMLALNQTRCWAHLMKSRTRRIGRRGGYNPQ